MSSPQPSRPSQPIAYVVMGVSGSGKSLVGAALANHLDVKFLEGDSLHPAANIEKMSHGIPLTDADRFPWLDRVGDSIRASLAAGTGLVVSCSALKKIYRDRLRGFADGRLMFIYLHGTEAVLAPRMAARTGHFMPASLLKSQLATLENPSTEAGVLTIDISGSTADVIASTIAAIDALA